MNLSAGLKLCEAAALDFDSILPREIATRPLPNIFYWRYHKGRRVSCFAQTCRAADFSLEPIMSTPENLEFEHALAFSEEGHVRIKSTCKRCGVSGIVSVRDGSLVNWESRHACAVMETASD